MYSALRYDRRPMKAIFDGKNIFTLTEQTFHPPTTYQRHRRRFRIPSPGRQVLNLRVHSILIAVFITMRRCSRHAADECCRGSVFLNRPCCRRRIKGCFRGQCFCELLVFRAPNLEVEQLLRYNSTSQQILISPHPNYLSLSLFLDTPSLPSQCSPPVKHHSPSSARSSGELSLRLPPM